MQYKGDFTEPGKIYDFILNNAEPDLAEFS